MDTVATPLPIDPPSKAKLFWKSFGHALLIGVGQAALAVAFSYGQKYMTQQAGNLIQSFVTTNGAGDDKI